MKLEKLKPYVLWIPMGSLLFGLTHERCAEGLRSRKAGYISEAIRETTSRMPGINHPSNVYRSIDERINDIVKKEFIEFTPEIKELYKLAKQEHQIAEDYSKVSDNIKAIEHGYKALHLLLYVKEYAEKNHQG